MLQGLTTFGSAQPPRAWFLAYQSKGDRPGAWLELDIDGVIDAVAGTEVKGIVVCPIGFRPITWRHSTTSTSWRLAMLWTGPRVHEPRYPTLMPRWCEP
jgi:hypothetical protein